MLDAEGREKPAGGVGVPGEKEFCTARKAGRLGEDSEVRLETGLKAFSVSFGRELELELVTAGSGSPSCQIFFIFSWALVNAATDGAIQPFSDAFMNPILGTMRLEAGSDDAAANLALWKGRGARAGSGSNQEE